MYSWEIQKLLAIKECLLEYQDYMNIIRTSPQINYVEYLPNEDMIHLTTDDNYDIKLKVYNR